MRASLKELVEASGLSLKGLQARTEISRQTWSKLLKGSSHPRRFHLLILQALIPTKSPSLPQSTREPWQRLPFPIPRCAKCGSRTQRVRRKIIDGKVIYAWRCVKARIRKCDAPRIWTNEKGEPVNRPLQVARVKKNIGVIRPECDRCGRVMAFVGKRTHPIFGSLWTWRCEGRVSEMHKSLEAVTDYSGNRVKLRHIRSWGWKLLPFELKRLSEMRANTRLGQWKRALESCSECGRPLQCDQRGENRWRLHCQDRCIEPYFVNDKGIRIELRRSAAGIHRLPRKARNCPTCGEFLSLSGDKWRKRRLAAHENRLIRLVCVSHGKRRHPSATLYFDLSKGAFLNRRHMKPGRRPGSCLYRRRCCGKPMWATWREATQREPAHWFLTCTNASCATGRAGHRKHLKIGLDGKALRWLKPPIARMD
jgi:hypothetical protein